VLPDFLITSKHLLQVIHCHFPTSLCVPIHGMDIQQASFRSMLRREVNGSFVDMQQAANE
jgi:hypothetical protein